MEVEEIEQDSKPGQNVVRDTRSQTKRKIK